MRHLAQTAGEYDRGQHRKQEEASAMRQICRSRALVSIDAITALAATVAAFGSPAIASEAPWLANGAHAPSAFIRRFSHERMAKTHGAALSGFARDGLPTRIRELGTYAGSIGAVRDRGNGNYFAIDAALGSIGGQNDHGNANFIRVKPDSAEAACREENGVCVIRP
jgi:hypothetical protein